FAESHPALSGCVAPANLSILRRRPAFIETSMPRLFTGLEIPPDIAMSLSMLRGGLPGARWIDPANYHLTLRFIGDVDAALARDIALMLGQVKRRGFDL